MPKKNRFPTFVGDIAAEAPVRVDRKNGSRVLTLDKALAERVGPLGAQLAAAILELGGGQSVLLIAAHREDHPNAVCRRD